MTEIAINFEGYTIDQEYQVGSDWVLAPNPTYWTKGERVSYKDVPGSILSVLDSELEKVMEELDKDGGGPVFVEYNVKQVRTEINILTFLERV